MSSWLKKSLAFSLTAAFMFLLSACSGGGGSSAASSFLSGTVAGGAAVVGFVQVKGANGGTARGDIDINGKYSIDVTSLTAPYILFARGTVNGKTVRLYSVGVAAGTINITPVTDLIVANALGDAPANGFANWGAKKDTVTGALGAAKAKVRTQLQPILTAAGVGDADDLITAKFDADHTKMDAALDSLDITFDATTGKTATIKNRFTGTTLTDKVDDDTDDQDFDPGEEAATTTNIADTGSFNALFRVIETLFATSKPTLEQMDAQFWPLVALDFFEDGLNKGDTIAAWGTGDQGPPVGIKMSGAIIRPMTGPELQVTENTYTKGFLININFVSPGGSESFKTFVVFDGTQWLWFGNQQWVQVDIHAETEMLIETANMQTQAPAPNGGGNVTFKTGWGIFIQDPKNVASANGINSAIVTGPGLPPTTGLILDRNLPKDYFRILSSRSGPVYWESRDAVLAAVPENSEYTVGLYTQSSLAVNFLNDTPLQTITVRVPSKPLLNADLNASLFWTLTAPTSHALSAANIPGSLAVSWTNPDRTISTARVRGAGLGWEDAATGNQNQVENEISKAGQRSITLDTSTFTNDIPFFPFLWTWGADADGRQFRVQWNFESSQFLP